MRFRLLVLIFLTATISAAAQTATLKGKVTDAKTKETVPGVNIVLDDNTGGTTDANGQYSIKIIPGKRIVNFIFVGYSNEMRSIEIREGETLDLNVALKEESQVISEVVVSAGRFEQKLSEVTVSMEVIKPAMLENNNTVSMDVAVNQVPGVDVLDDQASIRGGSGYSYGAGSRVIMLVDDMPIMSADVGDVKWNFIPIENVSQVEIIKGASSALFGSSALNGVINFRTAFPGETPKTKVTIFNGFYMNPERGSLRWWGESQPLFAGASFLHLRRLGNFDLVVGGNVYSDDGYRQFETEERARTNVNLRYRDKKVEGLAYGLNMNAMTVDKTDFFLWQNADSGAWMQNPDAITRSVGIRFNADPYITYSSKKGHKHSLKSRYYLTDNKIPNDSNKDSRADLYFMEYQYQRNLKNNLNWTLGATGSYGEIVARLFGTHNSSNASVFTQFDKKIGLLNLSAGMRAEYFRIDKEETVIVVNGDSIKKIPVQPVFRFGANYQLAEFTFIRTSFGQGYRFPSVAEKFTMTNLGALNIFPNPDLNPETGWSAEFGFKQGFKVSGWNGYVDIAGFWTEYHDMMEYTFGLYNPETYNPIDTANPADMQALATYGLGCVGFQSINVGNSRISGVDIVVTGAGKLFGLPAILLAGYTYTNPIDLNINAADTTQSTNSRILKYRYYHSLKLDLEVQYRRVSAGVSMIYNSNMINIDKAFEEPLIDNSTIFILPGLKEYRADHNKGFMVFDLRLSMNLTEHSKFSVVVKNLLNREYMGRPADIRPPRSLSLQYTLNL